MQHMPIDKGAQKKKLTVLVVKKDFSEKVTCELTRYQAVGVFQGGKSLRGAFQEDGIECSLTGTRKEYRPLRR